MFDPVVWPEDRNARVEVVRVFVACAMVADRDAVTASAAIRKRIMSVPLRNMCVRKRHARRGAHDPQVLKTLPFTRSGAVCPFP